MPTERETDVLKALALHRIKTGEYPTRTALGAALGITGVTAHLHLQRLHTARYVAIRPRQHRGVALTQKGWSVVNEQGPAS